MWGREFRTLLRLPLRLKEAIEDSRKQAQDMGNKDAHAGRPPNPGRTQDSQAYLASYQAARGRAAAVMNDFSRGNHHAVVSSLLPHHSDMSDEERRVYDQSLSQLSPPKFLADKTHEALRPHIERWSTAPAHYGKAPIFDAYEKMDDHMKKAHAVHIAATWPQLAKQGGEMDDRGYLTVYRRPTQDDVARGFTGRSSGDASAAQMHDWGGSSWSMNRSHVQSRAGDRPGLSIKVHHSQVLAHPASHTVLGTNAYGTENEVILRPGARIDAKPCGGDPKFGLPPC